MYFYSVTTASNLVVAVIFLMNEQQQNRLETELIRNESINSGIVTSKQIFSINHGPSMGPEVLVLLHADEQWGDRFWYCHLVCAPDDNQFVVTLFRSNKFLNGASVELLFKRLFHWTVIDPQIQAPATVADGDCYGMFENFDQGIEGLCQIISRFCPGKQNISSQNHLKEFHEDPRILHFYDLWSEKFEILQAYPIPP